MANYDKLRMDFEKALAVLLRFTARMLAKKPVRTALQSLGTILMLLLLISLISSMMNDEDDNTQLSSSQTKDAKFDPKTLPFADDDETEGESLLGGDDIDTVEAQLRGQLLDFFSRYNPEKTKTVDAVVAKYSRNIEGLNTLLKKKYNADLNSFRNADNARENQESANPNGKGKPEQPQRPVTPPPTGVEDTETRLRKFFLKYNPEKLGSVKQLVKKYSLAQLNSKLRKKYGSDLDDESRIQASQSGSKQADSKVASLERQVSAFYSKHRPGEAHAWVSRFVELYRDQLDTTLGQKYGYRLDGTKVDMVDDATLKRSLERFFREHNPEKLSSVDEAVAKYRADIGKLNIILRKKYGVDLNGKRADAATPELDLLRVKFISKMGDIDLDPPEPEGRAAKTSSYLRSLFDRVRTEADDDDGDDERDEDTSEFDHISEDERAFDESATTTRRPQEFDVEDGLPDLESKVRMMCFGMPLTGCDTVRLYSGEALDFTSLSDMETFKRLEHALLQSAAAKEPHFDVFYDQTSIFGTAPSYFFQELIATYPEARIVIAVRDVDEWWTEIESLNEKGRSWFCANVQGDVVVPECLQMQRRLEQLLLGWNSQDHDGTDETVRRVKKNTFQTAYQNFYDLLLTLTPRHHRILIDIKGGFRAMQSLQYLGALFNAAPDRVDRWIDINLGGRPSGAKKSIKKQMEKTLDDAAPKNPSSPPSSAEEAEADYLGSLHWISFSSGAASEHTVAKALLLGLDATGAEVAVSALSALDLVKTVSTTAEWRQHLLPSSKIICPVCESVKQTLSTGAKLDLTFEEDLIGGAPMQLFFREFLAYYGASKFLLTTRPLTAWLRDIRCFFQTFAAKEKKSLLRTSSSSASADVVLPPILSSVLLRLYGFPVGDYQKMDVSDYVLKRRHQDFVDLMKIVIPPERLLVFDSSQSAFAYDQLCKFLKMESKCSRLMALSNVRIARNVFC